MSYPVKFFLLSDGRQVEDEIKHILSEDEEYFRVNNLKISMEQLRTGELVVYVDYGATLPDDPNTPQEYMYIPKQDETCTHAMSQVRKAIERLKP